MKFGVREICDVVLKAKANQKIGNKIFYKHEPVIYFDTLKSSGMEGAATTVYAQGGRGNARLMAWEGERTVTFTMEDALISPEGFMILSGAGLIEATESAPIYQHVTQTVAAKYIDSTTSAGTVVVPVSHEPYFPALKDGKKTSEEYIYAFFMKEGEIVSEPYLASKVEKNTAGAWTISIATFDRDGANAEYGANYNPVSMSEHLKDYDAIMVDYYTPRAGGAKQIEITADKFGGNYYLEASTLFRNTAGVDMPAEFIIPNCKIQSNFNFSMASSGDPSTFTFTMDAFPDYTRFDPEKKVLAAIQIIEDSVSADNEISATDLRTKTNSKAEAAVAPDPTPDPGT